jgi:Fur family ferric uptake transcriptional regulator
MTLVKRNTWQREAVREALAASNGFVSAQQLHQTLQTSGSSIGLATVYRALASLAEQEEADCLQSPDGEQLYRSCSTSGHHHHLICRGCGSTVEIEAAETEAWTRSIASTHGFTDVTHVLDIFGLCAVCTASKN